MAAAEGARPSGVITVTTDFGHQGPFVGVIKGCILARFPEARLIDLTHEIVVHWPAEAGFWLARATSRIVGRAARLHPAAAGVVRRLLRGRGC